MCRGHDLLFSSKLVLPSLPNYHECVAHVPPFTFLEKIAFSAFFWSKFQLSSRKITEFSLPRPLIFQGKLPPWTVLLEIRAEHTHQTKIECPLRGYPVLGLLYGIDFPHLNFFSCFFYSLSRNLPHY